MTETSTLPGPIIELARLPMRADTRFAYSPNETQRNRIVADLGLVGLRKARLDGRLSPQGGEDWLLEARLGATAVQSCVVTLEPVTTRVESDVTRRYVADLPEPGEGEMEMPEDDTVEPLGPRIDLDMVFRDALALALPDYPRADGAALGTASFTEPGKAPMTDDDVKPFAALKSLRDGNKGDDDD